VCKHHYNTIATLVHSRDRASSPPYEGSVCQRQPNRVHPQPDRPPVPTGGFTHLHRRPRRCRHRSQPLPALVLRIGTPSRYCLGLDIVTSGTSGRSPSWKVRHSTLHLAFRSQLPLLRKGETERDNHNARESELGSDRVLPDPYHDHFKIANPQTQLSSFTRIH
jgi:hypothetical protein